MTVTTDSHRVPGLPSDLPRDLERALTVHFGERRSIVRIDRRPCPYASSFAIDELDVACADGSTLRLVLKDMRRDAMSERARLARPAFLYAPRRESHVYRQLLPSAPPGTATWFGTLPDARGEHDQLLLERIDGLELRLIGTFSIWEQAARWIGRFHRAFPSPALATPAHRDELLIYDEGFYWLWLERALQFSAERPTARRVLNRVACRYDAVIARLMRLPRTLIHGEFYPCNILIETKHDEVRVCPVDWEMAALGPGLIDLAALTTGWNERQQRALIRAWRGDLKRERISRELSLDLDCCRLHLAIRMLGWCDDWVPPPQHAHDWVAEAERLIDGLVF